tara:strand:+ start:5493 stop:6797 length:1305 start_codon:yes stop_codon:yes gene_type:complete
MGSLALLAKELGHDVSGCDANTYPPMSDVLQNQGIDLINGYELKDLPKADCYVIGNALSRGNPLVEEILKRNDKFISGPEWILQNILTERKVIAVSGTHGKTTTTSMIAWILEDLGFKPGYLIAGKPKNFEASSSLGSGDIFVIEADEYDTAFFDKRAKFIHYRPEVLVINNLEFDHADIYKDLEQIKVQFHHLVRTMSSDSTVITPMNEEAIDEVLSMGLWSNLIQYGYGNDSKYFYENLNKDFSKLQFSINGSEGILEWDQFGEYNAMNAMSAIISLEHFGINIADSINALKRFKGVARRQEILLDTENLVIIDDFAHHPTAIKQTLEGLRNRYPNKKIISLIELRSNTMKSGYHGKKLTDATEQSNLTYWSCEDVGVVEDLVLNGGNNHRRILSTDSLLEHLPKEMSGDDLIVLMSNGSFDSLNQRIIKEL